MRICDRCKDSKKQIVARLRDVQTGTEYDFCRECNEAFSNLLNNVAKPETKKAKRGD